MSAAPALATENHEEPEVINDLCGVQTEYVTGKDQEDARVTVNFAQYNKSVTITSGENYKIVSIAYDLFDLQHETNWVEVEVTESPQTVDPEGRFAFIKKVKIVVEKTCTDVCNDTSATNYEDLKEGETQANNELCVYPQVTPTLNKVTELPDTNSFPIYAWVILGFALGGAAGFVGRGYKK